MEENKVKISLRLKVIIGALALVLIIASITVYVCYDIYSDTVQEHYENTARNLALTAAKIVDKEQTIALTDNVISCYRKACGGDENPPDFMNFTDDDWINYYSYFEKINKTTEYIEIAKELEKIRSSNDVSSIYVAYMDVKTGMAIYIVNAVKYIDKAPPGSCDIIEKGNMALIEQGIYDFPPYITNYDKYAWLCTASSGIYDDDGNIIANAYVDISMNDVVEERQKFLLELLSILTAVTLILIVLIVFAISRAVVNPINTLAVAAEKFVDEKRKNNKSATAISQVVIDTGDEIENLCNSIKNMERDINGYIDELSVLTAEKERIGAELNVAAQIQESMLPCIFPAFPGRKEFDIYASISPAMETGEDFYDFYLIDDDHLAITVADVTGKGVPAAMFMIIAKTLLKNAVQTGLSPKEVLERVNNQLFRDDGDAEMFVSAWLGIYEISTGKLICANAGHEIPALKRANGRFELMKPDKDPILAESKNVQYHEYSIPLRTGDVLFLYTDGVTEALNSNNEPFGIERMLKSLNRREITDLSGLLNDVKLDIDIFTDDGDQVDDIVMLALEIMDTGSGGMRRLSISPKIENIEVIIKFFEDYLNEQNAPKNVLDHAGIVADEIFSNIVRHSGATRVSVCCKVEDGRAMFRFVDNGRPYDPMEREDPDITLSADERELGGLGIFVVKNSMDSIKYDYQHGLNVLTMEEHWDLTAEKND